MNKHIDNGKGFLKDKLSGYHVNPPPEVWDAISGRLNGRSRGRMAIIILSAAASIALAVTLGINYSGKEVPRDAGLATSSRADSVLPVLPVLPGTGEAPSIIFKKGVLEERVVEVLAEVSATGGDEKRAIALAPENGQEEEALSEPGRHPISEGMNEVSTLAVLENLPDSVEVPLEESAVDKVKNTIGDEISMDFDEILDKDPRWVLGAVISPLYSFRDAQPEALAGTSGQESGTVSYAAGVQVGYRATRRLAIESGVLYNKMGIAIGAPGIQVFSDAAEFAPAGPESAGSRVMAVTNTVGNIVSNSGEIYVNNYLLNASKEYNNVDVMLADAVKADQGIRQHLDYIEVPFNLRYTLLDRDFKIQLLGGMSTNLLVNNYVSMESGGITKEIGYLANIRNVNYSGNAGLGFIYHFLDQLSLSVEPRFRYYLNSVNDATLPSTRPYTFGIYTGINYFF